MTEERKALRDASKAMEQLKIMLEKNNINSGIDFKELDDIFAFISGYLACIENSQSD